MRGAGRIVFAATILLIVGTLNFIYGIGALGDANIFVGDQRFVLTNLSTLGWVLIVLGLIQLTGGFSLLVGNTYGRVIGMIGGSLGAIGALLSVGGANPWWSLCIFALCVWVVYGIIVFGEDEDTGNLNPAAPSHVLSAMRQAGLVADERSGIPDARRRGPSAGRVSARALAVRPAAGGSAAFSGPFRSARTY